MKKIFTLLASFAALVSYAQAPEAKLAAVLNSEVNGTERTIQLGTYRDSTFAWVDWGDGTLVKSDTLFHQNSKISSGNIKGAALGEGVIKIYCDSVWYFGTSSGDKLKSVDVSGLNTAHQISIGGAQLETIDLSKCDSLRVLSLTNNALKSLDLSANTLLTSLTANCSNEASKENSELTSIDLSNNTLLESLQLQNHKLTSIDLSKNTVLSQVYLNGNKLYGNYKFDSFYRHQLQPQIALAVENTETHDVQYLYPYDKEPGDPNDVELTWELDADLPDGNYILYPVGHGKEKNKQWQKAYFREQCQREVVLTVKDGVKTFNNATIIDPVREGAVEVDGLCYELDEAAGTATFTYRNDKYASYSGDIVIPEAITTDGKSYPVTAVGREAFRECKSLGNVTFGKNVTVIGWGAFDQAAAGDVTFAEGSQLNLIDQYGFYNASFNNIVLPEGLQTISAAAFANSNIKSITIPSTVTEFGYHCFGTTSLVSVHVNSSTPQAIPAVFRENVDGADFADYNDWVAYGTQASVLYVPAGAKEAYAQADVWKYFGFILEPDDDDSFVASITRDAIEVDGIIYQFNGVKSTARAVKLKEVTKNVIIKSFTFGGKTFDVTGIGNQFLDVTQYDKIVIPASVETVEFGAFQGEIGELIFEEGSHLKTIHEWGFNGPTISSPLVLPEGLETMEKVNINVSDITIPSTVTKMGEDNYLSNLKHCRVSWPTPLVGDKLFGRYSNYSEATLHVPEGTKALYAAAEGWKLFGTIVEDGGKSAIHTVSTTLTDSGAWYTLTGYRLNTQPTKSGLYIHNGKKVMIK